MSYPIDLSISGKPSPRVDHPRSACKGTQSPLNVNKTRSLQSNIFASNHNESEQIQNRQISGMTKNKEDIARNAAKDKAKPGVTFQKAGNEVSPYIITKSELEGIKQLTEQKVPEEAAKKEYAVYQTSRKSAPQGVPVLSLDEIIGKDDLYYAKTMEKDVPTNRESVSWGTPMKQKAKSQNTKGGGWQVSQSRPASVKPQSSRKHDDVPDLDLKLSQSNEALGQLREVVKQVDEDLRIEYLGKPKQEELENLKKRSDDKKNDVLEEAILAEQLSNLQMYKSTSQAAYPGTNAKLDTQVKRHNDLHSSSTMNIGNDADISKRLRFGARILTLNGRDARREINGFFITSDNTITMYEFRQFGTRSKALPFIQRGSYSHIKGHRRGEGFHLLDIAVGNNLIFETNNQSCLPDSLRKRSHITFRVTYVDEENKQMLLYDKCRTDKDRKDFEEFKENYFSQENNKEKEFLFSVQSAVCKSLKSAAEKVMMNLHHYLTQLDISADGLLNKEALREALQKYRIAIEDDVFDQVWKIADCYEHGKLDYGEFMRAYFGEMSEQRKLLVRRSFARLDPAKTGVGELSDIKKYYSPSQHPAVTKGEISESQLLDELIQCFKPSRHKTEISFSEFEVYYEAVSMGVEDDQSFINLLRMTWNI